MHDYDDGREIRDQIVDFDTIQDPHPSGLTLWKEASAEVLEARFYSIKSFPEKFALWQMGSLIGDLMQPALQYSAPFLLTLGVHMLDPNVTKSVVTANHVRATQNAKQQDGRGDADVGKKLTTGRRGQRHRHRRQPGQPVPPAAIFTHPGQGRGGARDRQRDLARRGFPAQRRRLHAPAGLAGQPADDADCEDSTQDLARCAASRARPCPTPSTWRR